MAKELLKGLHDNLWKSLESIFSTDRVLLSVAYLVNFASFITLVSLLPNQLSAALIAILCLVLLNTLIFASLSNSKKEVVKIIMTLSKIYKDNDLSEYFDGSKTEFYVKRYNQWLALTPALMVFAIIIALAVEYVA